MLTRSKIEFTEKKPGIESSELSGLMKQRPNKHFMGIIRFKLWAYTQTLDKKETRMRRWMKNTVGERPMILDTMLMRRSCMEMEKYLGNVGYFYSNVHYSIDLKAKNKRAHVTYWVRPSQPYVIKGFYYDIKDDEMRSWVFKDTSACLIKAGKIYNVYTLDRERERITQFLNNNGYYGFVRDYIYFEVDSAFGTKEMDVTLKIKNITTPDPDTAGKFIEERHFRYKIDKVVIYPDFDPSVTNYYSMPFDTIVQEVHQISADRPANIYYIKYRNKLRIRPKVLSQNILIENGDAYNMKDVRETHKRFANLSIFNYRNINFVKVPPSDPSVFSKVKSLECRISLQRAPVHQYSIEAEGTNSGGDLGIGSNITYRNRNIFRGGEAFQLKIKGALEAQKSGQPEEQVQKTLLFFNTYEYGLEAQINFPRFLIPVKMERFPKYFRPTTTISSGINFRKRPTYDRYILNFTFGYKWQESITKTHILQPFNISSVKVYPTPEFTQELDDIDDPRLKNQYTDHLITALHYSFIFNNQDIKKVKNFIYFRGDIETSGNLFYLFNNILESKQDSGGFYRVIGIRYAQYVKTELDFRYYWLATKNNQIVFRAHTGIGLPYGNSDVLPFEKGFYLGGANSMRAWIYRGLGPGGFSDQGNNFDKMGDIVLEGNVEYRFPMYNFLKGAFFVDAGNVWLINENENFPKGEFKIDKFYKQIAIDAGAGIRFDFNFFIFRVDFAWRFRDPSKPEGNRWVADKGIWFWNFGIGYPF
ncbi:MAG TPA: BamA/TamA family outer membrane protein [Bacteroidales bacterium]|nr:BamA/TamA family outer membrane protein [Bacteroidales bacterium]